MGPQPKAGCSHHRDRAHHRYGQRRIAHLRIIWQAAMITERSMTAIKKGRHTRTTSEDAVDLVRRLAQHYDDKTIALILSKEHRSCPSSTTPPTGRRRRPRRA